jgi:hypothetical protein
MTRSDAAARRPMKSERAPNLFLNHWSPMDMITIE